MEGPLISPSTVTLCLRAGLQALTEKTSAFFCFSEVMRRNLSLPVQQQVSRTCKNSAGGEATEDPKFNPANTSCKKARCPFQRLLTTKLFLIQISCSAACLLRFADAAGPGDDTNSLALNEPKKYVHGLSTVYHGHTDIYSRPTPAEPAAALPSVGIRTIDLYPQNAAAQRTGFDFGSDNEASGFSALAAEKTSAQQPANIWEGLLDKYDVPLVHGSGVKVDLGNDKQFRNKKYREPGGYCPVYGKYIQLHQPTRDRKIWPNDYLVSAPLSGSPQDTTPLGGGFGLPIPKFSPSTLDQLKKRVQQADALQNPHEYMMRYRRKIQDDLGHCIWWTRITFAQDPSNKDTNLDNRYRYSIVYDEEKKLCTLLYINMQEMTGAKTYCTRGNEKPALTWYCFSSMKTLRMKKRVWASPYTHMDHAEKCPRNGLKHVHWGQWNGKECQRLAPRKRVSVKNAAECAIKLFENSPSDNPTKYVGDEGRGWDQILSNAPGVLIPAGSTGRDHPHSRGVGVNWANYYPKLTIYNPRFEHECEMYDGVPDCLSAAPHGFAFVSLASPDPDDATLPPCSSRLEAAIVAELCKCPPNKRKAWKCTKGQWEQVEQDCICEKGESSGGLNAWLICGPILSVGVLLGGLAAYVISKRGRRGPQTQRGHLDTEAREHQVQQRKTQTDLLQEAEPSFWKEAADDDPTVVLYDGDQMEQEF